MSTRTSSAALLALLAAACAQGGDGAPVDEEDRIECALRGSASFTRDCWVEAAVDQGRSLLVVHHPDGGFRRFEWVNSRGGPVLETADGAERAQAELRFDVYHVIVGNDRYRIPSEAGSDD